MIRRIKDEKQDFSVFFVFFVYTASLNAQTLDEALLAASVKMSRELPTNTKVAVINFQSSSEKANKRHKEQKINKVPEILWEGGGLIAVNKQAGISVHGRDSLDTDVRSYLADKLPASLSFTPGPLHRLDKPTSGIVVFSVNLEGARLFSSLMRERKIKKTYLAIINGALKAEEIWQDDLVRDKTKKKTFVSQKNKIDNDRCAKEAVTKVTPLMSDNNLTLITAEIATGRTHQIRVQAATHGFPLLGDVKYSKERERGIIRDEELGVRNLKIVDIFLHAWRMEFLDFFIEAPLPQTWIPIASRIASTSVFRSGSLPEIPGISTSSG